MLDSSAWACENITIVLCWVLLLSYTIFWLFVIFTFREEVAITSPLQLDIFHISTLPWIECASTDARPASATEVATVFMLSFDRVLFLLCNLKNKCSSVAGVRKDSRQLAARFGSLWPPPSSSHLLFCVVDEENAVTNNILFKVYVVM